MLILVASVFVQAGDQPQNMLIQNSKQLTFDGVRAGEGYFSADGKTLVFQSERDSKNPFYQIFTLNLATGDTRLISNGTGKTTCSWIHPNGHQIMYSSTHLDPNFKAKVQEELKTRNSPEKKGYSWSYDETFDIFSKDIQTGVTKRLTKEMGYDAEGSYSPDGKWIAFASNRNGYNRRLSDEDQKIFDKDPSYMMDIFIMKADGTEVKQLTDVKGYDGGPFFSADGKHITWRRFTPLGSSAEIYTMNLDGSDQKAITSMKVMSWAPFYYPSGDYIVFTSNKLGFQNFELFIVDSQGKHDPVQVSFLQDFDGLPVFSPDGKKISWTHRNQKGESQIMLADWDDTLARKLLSLPSQIHLSLLNKTSNPAGQSHSEFSTDNLKKWVTYLASEELQGRKTGSYQESTYTNIIAEYFSQLKLVPSLNSEFQQPFQFISKVSLGEKNILNIQGKDNLPVLIGSSNELTVEKDFIPLSFSGQGHFSEGDLVFAGYGIKAPALNDQPEYDSFKGLDVKDKWILAFRDIPENIPDSRRIHLNMYSRIQHKAMATKNLGAKGLLIVSGPNSQFQKKLPQLKFDGGIAEGSLPVLFITDELGEKLVATTGRTLKKWQDSLDLGGVQNTPVSNIKVSADIVLKNVKSTGHNVLATFKAPFVTSKTATIVIGAHGDHLGLGDVHSSLGKQDELSKVHYGADDNASGVAALMELARYYSEIKTRNPKSIKNNLVFAVWSGEELGLLGSTHFIKSDEAKKMNIKAYLNMDMIGRYRDHLLIQAVGSADQWKSIVEKLATTTDLSLATQEDPYLPTDSMAFYMAGIPTISLFTGAHSEYHSPRDIVALINFEGLLKSTLVMRDMIQEVQNRNLTYRKVESSKTQLEGRSFRLYLGTIPDYSQESIKGVKITGTSKESPAEKAGIKPDDIIIELAGQKVENIYDYVYCLQTIQAGKPVIMKVLRQSKVVELPITPALKE